MLQLMKESSCFVVIEGGVVGILFLVGMFRAEQSNKEDFISRSEFFEWWWGLI